MPFNILNKGKASIPVEQPVSSQPSSSNDIPFKALKVAIHGKFLYYISQISYRQTKHNHEGNAYFVPKPFEPSRPENKGVPFRMFVLDFKEDDVFSKKSSEWRGMYSVWYRSDLQGNFYLVKQQDSEPMTPGTLIRYVDIPQPQPWTPHFWFLSELVDIRRKILAEK